MLPTQYLVANLVRRLQELCTLAVGSSYGRWPKQQCTASNLDINLVRPFAFLPAMATQARCSKRPLPLGHFLTATAVYADGPDINRRQNDNNPGKSQLFRRRREGLLLACWLRKDHEVVVVVLHQGIAHCVERSLQLGQV